MPKNPTNLIGGTDDTDLSRNSKDFNYFTYWDSQCPVIDSDLKKRSVSTMVPVYSLKNSYNPIHHLGTGRSNGKNIDATICCRFSPMGPYANYLEVCP